MRSALTLFAALAALAAQSAPADACSPPEEGWMMIDILPEIGPSLPANGPIILQGEAFFPVDMNEVATAIDFELVDHDGLPVTGAFSMRRNQRDLVWWPSEPLIVGADYTLTITSNDDWVAQVWGGASYPFTVTEPLEPTVMTEGGLRVDLVEAFEAQITGDCIGDDFCGGCFEREVLGEAIHWSVGVSLALPPGPYAPARSGRMALGVDEAEALAILERTPPHVLFTESEAFFHRSAGLLEAWPAAEACVAVEIFDPLMGQFVLDTACFAVPEHAEVHRHGEPPVVPTGDGDGGGCDASGDGSNGAAWWGLALLVGLARRRRLGAAVAAVALLMTTGCTPDAPGDASGETEQCDPIVCGGPEAPALPEFVVADTPPPPIMGGAMATTETRAIIGDPDRDRVFVVDLESDRQVSMLDGGQPGRVTLDDTGARAFVTLRADGDVLVIDTESGRGLARHPVCSAPRGIAFDAGTLHVACAGGALVSLDADTGVVDRRLALAPDLRDVVIAGGHLHVSRFRQPELLTLDRRGAVIARRAPRLRDALNHGDPSAATVAWRTIALPTGGVAMLHQRAQLSEIVTSEPGGYGGSTQHPNACGASIVAAEITVFPPVTADDGDDITPRSVGVLRDAVLAVDLAVVGQGFAVAVPGNSGMADHGWAYGILNARIDEPSSWGGCIDPIFHGDELPQQQVTAIAAHGDTVLAFRRDAPSLLDVYGDRRVAFSAGTILDTGHTLFHADAGRGIACASCHPEGGDDGHAWHFEGHGLRRTQELRGGLAGSAPFHWTGDMSDMQHLMDEVMTRRMGGPQMPVEYTDAMLGWIDAQPVETVDPIEVGDPIAGEVVFHDTVVGCAACHSGRRFSDNQRYDVGTGGAFVTPTLLGIGRRGSMMHDSCGSSLADRFDPACGGGDAHGRTSHLGAGAVRDLIAYLSTL